MNTTSQNTEELSPLQRAFVTIKELRSRLDAVETATTEPIAIIGTGCRFPGGANDPESFWEILRDGVDTIQEVPSNRWNVDAYYDPTPETPGKTYTRNGGFLSKIDEFDAEFFGLHPREVTSMDPQQRLLLEVSWETLENAGIAPEKLTGSKSGVFLGISVNEYGQQALFNSPTDIDVYAATGNALSVAAGRLSYSLGWQGPAMVVETACSSSLLAVHLACQSLRAKECNLAVAGGVYLMVSPQTTIAMSKLQALSPDGRCKTFDAAADGYGRGEGCGMVLLKRLSDAINDEDNILAVIRGSAVNQDGRSSGLTVPNAKAQQEVIRTALENARVEPGDISYVEAHGTGTSLGDPLEVKALTEVLRGKNIEAPALMLGSVKTNIGHLEAGAGIASLIKVVLAMQHGEIPPHLNLTQLNPHISEVGIAINIPTELTPWLPTKDGKLFAGVSSFAFSGTNSHLILESFDQVKSQKSKVKNEGELERPLHLLTVSGKTETALKELKNRYQKYLEAHPEVELADICFTSNTGRSHFSYRLAVVGESSAEILQQLVNIEIPAESTVKPKIAFLFSGVDSQYINMGRQLFDTQPIFRKTLERCDEIIQPYFKESLLQILYPEVEEVTSKDLDETYSKIALFSIEYALAELWKSWGIEPDVVMGEDVGEYVAACVAGVFSLEDALKLIAKQQMPSEINYSPPSIGFISHMTGKLATRGEIATPDYWQQETQNQINFSANIETLSADGQNLFLEISPNPIFINMAKQQSLENLGTWLPSLEKTQSDWQVLLSSLAKLYRLGADIDWSGFDRDYQRQRLQLPTYPFQRQRYWINKTQNHSTTTLGAKISHPLLDKRLYSPLAEIQFESQFTLDRLPLVNDHRIDGMPVMNLVIYLEMVVAAVQEAFGKLSYHFEDISISQALIMPENGLRTVQIILSSQSEDQVSFKIFSLPTETDLTNWVLNASGKVCFDSKTPVETKLSTITLENYPEKIPSSEFYSTMMEKMGVKLGKSCQLLDTVWRKDGEAIAKIQLPENPDSYKNYLLPLGDIDAWIQTLPFCYPGELSGMELLVEIEKFEFYGYSGQQLWAKAKLELNENNEQITQGNLWLFDDTETVIGKITNAKLKQINFETLRRAANVAPLKKAKLSNTGIKPRHQSKISPEQVFATSGKERSLVLEKYIIEELAVSLQLNPSKINSQEPLATMIDSLMASELRSRIETDLQVRLPMEDFIGENNIAKLASAILEKLNLANLTSSKPLSKDISEDIEEIVL
ncbi:MAG: acyltransferase domain-containing protein [Okeania sp. SIO2G4]|uniref:beta-ketoacyl synthase N-terminal-like domain-containing protein n=1 Tax=unclassified Okeania TaxID=2634635 RepID=UPI0013B71601|nr:MULTISPECIES: beta-ketoacyl synthase N-terminal-like domain-containing protein [unclassified Okeania]NEP72545.1 acyltransferase domain-containing protein [Okeania sp. SIO2G5]NEP94137.1 acyltransferase domain-containing protein [Okeania sp. SIO2F5]NEQ91254.1 acyltransferase domain-containing protein [Okeania sp. SIO2G4]